MLETCEIRSGQRAAAREAYGQSRVPEGQCWSDPIHMLISGVEKLLEWRGTGELGVI